MPDLIKRRTFLESVLLAKLARASDGQPAGWIRNTFPSPAHKAHPEIFPPGQGADRGEWLMSFGVSPADPRFMLYTFDIGSAAYNTDGKFFQPAEVPHERSGLSVAFHPHKGDVGYILFSLSTPAPPASTASGINGIWRTEDKGKTWSQIYSVPAGSSEGFKRYGKHLIQVDPQPSRGNQIYFASLHRGLVRSTDNGKSWAEVAFHGSGVISLAAACRPEGATVLYAIVAGKADKSQNPKAGRLHRIDVAPGGDLATVELDFDEVTDIEVDSKDPSRGFLLRGPGPGRTRGGSRLTRFDRWGEAPGRLLRESAPRKLFGAVYVNPWNNRHVVLTVDNESKDFVQFSTDGGETWNAPRRVVNGSMPDFTTYSPVHHKEANNYLPVNAPMQAQGRNVAFVKDSPRTVLFWSTYFDKHPYRSDDYGQTFRPFACGSPFKQGSQISVGPSEQTCAIGRLEYGMILTGDGGMSWRGYHLRNDPTLRQIDQEFTAKRRQSWRNHTGWGMAIKPDEPSVVLGVFGLAAIVRTSDFGATWSRAATIESCEPGYAYWNRQNTRIVYAANQRSSDAGLTWRAMDRYILAMSASNGSVIVGTRFLGVSRAERREDDMTAPAILSLSTDAGETWTDLPALPQEAMPGDGGRYNVSVLDYVSHAVAIDPGPGLRILVAGRHGIYEYLAAGRRWQVHSRGFAPNRYHQVVEPVPWLGDVVFDPRPGYSHVVYAAQTNDLITETSRMRDWAEPKNKNKSFPAGQTYRPLYRSMDGGRSWTNLHGAGFPGIPNHLTVSCIEVSASGTLYVDGFMGLYSFPPATKKGLHN